MLSCTRPAWRDAFAAPQLATGAKLCSVSSAGGHVVLLLIALGLLQLSLEIKFSVVPAPTSGIQSQVRQQVLGGGVGVCAGLGG